VRRQRREWLLWYRGLRCKRWRVPVWCPRRRWWWWWWWCCWYHQGASYREPRCTAVTGSNTLARPLQAAARRHHAAGTMASPHALAVAQNHRHRQCRRAHPAPTRGVLVHVLSAPVACLAIAATRRYSWASSRSAASRRAIGGEPALRVAVEQAQAAVGLVVGAGRRQAAERVVAPAVGVAAQLAQPIGVDIALGLARRVLADHDGHAIGDK
jgi:hypothetical protein